MLSLKVAALAVAITGGMLTLAPADAQAQGWGGHYGNSYSYGYRHAPQPQYIHPKILRKQAELQARVYQKYGYVQPRHHYGYGRPHHYGYNHQPRGYGHADFFTW